LRLIVGAVFGSKARSVLLSALQPTKASGDLIPCTLLIIFIVWVLVAGYATATECAASGVPGSLAIAVLKTATPSPEPRFPSFSASSRASSSSRWHR